MINILHNPRQIFWCAFVLAALIRAFLLPAFWNQPLNIVDEQHYQLLAKNIAEHGEFAFSPDKPTAIRPPLYPTFLSGVYKLARSEYANAVRILQILFSLAAGIIVWRMGREVWGEAAAALGAALFLLYPTLIFFNYLILTETLFVLLFVEALFFLHKCSVNDNLGAAAFAGVLIGLSSLVRSIAYPLALPIALLLVWHKRKSLRKGFTVALVFMICFAGVLAPWIVRNYSCFGEVVPVGTMGGLNLSMGNYEYTPLHRSWAAVGVRGKKSWGYVYRDEIRGLNEAEKQQESITLAKEYILNHPGQTMLRSVIKLANFWGLERTILAGAQESYFPALANRYILILLVPAILIPYIFVAVCGFFGLLWRLIYEWHPFDVLFALVLILITGMHTIIFGHSRYHLPLIPVLCGYAAWSAIHFRRLWTQHRQRVLTLALTIIVFFGAAWSYGMLIGSRNKVLNLLKGIF